jgi:hypothetical protein
MLVRRQEDPDSIFVTDFPPKPVPKVTVPTGKTAVTKAGPGKLVRRQEDGDSIFAMKKPPESESKDKKPTSNGKKHGKLVRRQDDGDLGFPNGGGHLDEFESFLSKVAKPLARRDDDDSDMGFPNGADRVDEFEPKAVLVKRDNDGEGSDPNDIIINAAPSRHVAAWGPSAPPAPNTA